MVLDTVEREAEQKNLHTQIQIPSLMRSWVGVWRKQDPCDEEPVRRIWRWQSRSYGENPSEADLEHLRILQGQLTEYQKGPQQGLKMNLFWELFGDPVELKEDAEPNPAQLGELKGRILKNDGNVQSSCWFAGGNWWW